MTGACRLWGPLSLKLMIITCAVLECLNKCLSGPLHVWIYVLWVLFFTIANFPGPQLCSRWTLELSNPAHITVRRQLSKLVPHRGNQLYCSCHGKQASSPLVSRRYCCRALAVKKTDDAQMLPTSAGAVKPLQSKLELTVQTLQIFGCSLCTAALLLRFFLYSSISQPSVTPPCSFSLAELSLASPWLQGGYPALHSCMCGGGDRAPGEEKLAQSSGHVLCCCCSFLKEWSCLPSQEQNYAFACCATAESPRASPNWV